MFFDASRIDFVALGLGFLVWMLALAVIWRPGRRPLPQDKTDAFLDWKKHHDLPHASFDDFLASGDGPKRPMSRNEQSIVLTLVALMVFYFAMVRWGALY